MDIKQISERTGMGIVSISERLGLSRGAASQWDEVPPKQVLPLCELVEWKVTPHQVRPDLYPHPMDGLPAAMRSGCECKGDTPEPEVRSRSCGDRREDDRRSTDDSFGEFGERRGTDRRDDDRRTTCADESAV